MFNRYRNWFLAALASILAVFGYQVYAVDVSITSTAPTLNTDGSPLTNLASIKLYKVIDVRATPNCTTAQPYTLVSTTPYTIVGGTFTVQDANQTATGRHCYREAALNASGAESAMSLPAWKDVDLRVPNAPTGLVVN
jgi:hypothetical protein